tara:strand:- start:87 stop:209 length:123 start_codon:yes stop_codon:yes gene_type:complete
VISSGVPFGRVYTIMIMRKILIQYGIDVNNPNEKLVNKEG